QDALLVYSLDDGTWSLFAPDVQCRSADLPGNRHDEGNAGFDPLHQVYLSKGNLTLGCGNDGTYVYDVISRQGRRLLPILQPRKADMSASAFDTDHDAWILFGGDYAAGVSSETFIFHHDTGEWTAHHPNPSPMIRSGHAQVYDRKHRKTVV